MRKCAKIRRTALPRKGARKLPNVLTSLLETTPAAVAMNPFMSVARPMMEDTSPLVKLSALADDASHDSKQEKRMAVENPPRARPRRRTGKKGKAMRMQDVAYVMQNIKHVFLRPLYVWNS